MWRLSDELLSEFERNLEESYNSVVNIARNIKHRWRDLPEPQPCSVCGVDGSRGLERLSGIVFYVISAASVGEDIREIHEVSTLRPHVHIEERVRLHMHISEFRLGSLAEEEIVLMDGTLRGAIIRPPAYIDRDIYTTLSELYDLDGLIDDFIMVLDRWYGEIAEDVIKGVARKDYLLTRSEYFDKIERGCRKGKIEDKNNLMILMEYIEYLHALNRLLEKDVVFVAKSFYTNEFTPNSFITDAAVLDFMAREQFGEERAGFIHFKPDLRKSLPWYAKKFNNLTKTEIFGAFVRFADGANIYMLESSKPIEEETIAKLCSFEAEGYLIPLIHAHRHAEIKRKELKNIMSAMLSAVDPKYSFLLKRGREPLER
ncbi:MULTISPECIES: DNA double-strand break repair nuclease NurA [unclassified Archaeoglobus]|jgi:NurA-like 5'-3' nuclease|uniref:DNA double-strand break repair nuclease NurA n=1 Tax=unclassified Archaeoglobus TaxID=2643606 RepID=UPI0025BE4D91|nr:MULTISPECIES: DNA double-strand break repair nuclease NurA [unclassified Archaeoglobus]